MKLNVRTLLNESLPFLLALMTFMTILISARTLDEMRRQREDANRPELYATKDIGEFRIEMDSTGWVTASGMDSIPWMDASNSAARCSYDLLYKVGPLSDSLVFEFVNVGRGPAIDIRLEWEYSDSAIQDHWMTYVGDSIFPRWYLEEIEERKGVWMWRRNRSGGCGSIKASSEGAQDYSFLLPADLNPEALEVDLWEVLIYVQLTQLHQRLMNKGWEQGRVDAIGLQSTHRLNIQYRSIDEAVFRQQFDVMIETSFDWGNKRYGGSGPARFKDPWFSVEVSIEPAGKEEVDG